MYIQWQPQEGDGWETSLDREAATSVPITGFDDMDLLSPPTPDC